MHGGHIEQFYHGPPLPYHKSPVIMSSASADVNLTAVDRSYNHVHIVFQDRAYHLWTFHVCMFMFSLSQEMLCPLLSVERLRTAQTRLPRVTPPTRTTPR
jgi:hypothetical protein